MQEFDSTLKAISAMKVEDRKAWEKSKGFKSFGTISDNIYDNIDPEKFKSVEEINTFVKLNSANIQLYTDNKGDIYCLPIENDNVERYLLNEDKMYIIGTSVYKKFDNDIISTNIANIKALKEASNPEMIQSSISHISENKTSIQKVSTLFITSQEENGDWKIGHDNYRLNLRIATENAGSTHVRTTVKLTNFARYLGIWWARTRNCSYEITSMKVKDISYKTRIISQQKMTNNIKSSIIFENNTLYGSAPAGQNTSPQILGYEIHATNDWGCKINVTRSFE